MAVARLVLLHWDEEEAQGWAQGLREAGWDVAIEAEDPSRAYRHIRHLEPDVVVVSLERRGDRGFRAAEAVRATRWVVRCPSSSWAGPMMMLC